MSDYQDLLDKVESLQSELNATNAELEFCRRRYGSIIENTPSGVCITDEDGIFEYVNPAYCRIYGYKEDELIGESFLKVVPEEYHEFMDDLHRKYIDGEEEVQGEWEVVNARGERLVILADAARIRGVDGRRYKATFITDITERRRIEELKEDVERMTRHDLRGPLTSFINFPELMYNCGPLNKDQEYLVNLIQQSGRKMLNIIRLSLDLYKIEEGTYNFCPEEKELISFLESLIYESARQMTLYEDSYVFDAPAGEKFVVMAEDALLESIFKNIFINAFEASADVVHEHPVRVSVRRGNGEFIVSVTNMGEVPEDIRETFFEKYVTSGKSQGTGIGTYMASLAARVHGGKVELDCSDGGRTTITVSLPEASSKVE